MTSHVVYLSSLESTRFEPVRVCRIRDSLTFDSGKQAVRADIHPAVPGQDLNRSADLATVILVPRHEGATIDPIDEFPCFVAITVSRQGYPATRSPIRSDDLEILGWGELYRTRHDAEAHVID